ncbi:MAG: hypothetical protein DI598_08790 [Pseudopedobacter saltans]|uniref:UspA domain-containing protein n=1 Tax=Pseudopedobacter saltans TaxID=151895 RepID=A0A2W5F0R1_9SPHI|nr:MAG: hypothetical protein DI598_08790 [Pseudopedobacter saltans]
MTLQNLLFPTDFTPYSKNAIAYGIHLANTLKVKSILVVHVYAANSNVTNQPIINSALPEILQEKQNELERIKLDIKSKVNEEINVLTLLVEGKLIPIIHELIKSQKIDLTITGISTKTKLEQNFIGSNTINIMRKTTCPILAVPHKAKWVDNPVTTVAIDISHNTALIPFENTKSIIEQLQVGKLFLLNIDDDDDHNAHIQNPNIDRINFQFKDHNSKLDVITHPNKLQAIEKFCHQKSVTLLILFERKYGILETIFHTSLTRQLAFKVHTPILVLEETTIK